MEGGVHLASKSVIFSVCLFLSLQLSLSVHNFLSSVERAMLGYEWGSHSSPPPQLILTDDINHDPSSSSSSHHHRPIFHDPYSTPCTFHHDNDPPSHPPPPPSTSSTAFSLYDLQTAEHHHHHHHQQPLLFNDPRAFSCASYSPAPSMLSFDAFPPPTGYPVLVPKAEPDYATRIGLNLGGRTYFSTDDDLVSRLYRRSRPAEALNSPRCQAEGCNADLSTAKHYHRRHKVCEFHSKAATVITAGLTQRFCQQCSRFHQLSEFDNGKRSCRKRLADHNRRRRKSNQTNAHDHRPPTQSDSARNSPSQSVQRSPSDSGANSSSSVTVAISPPRASFDSNLRQRLYE